MCAESEHVNKMYLNLYAMHHGSYLGKPVYEPRRTTFALNSVAIPENCAIVVHLWVDPVSESDPVYALVKKSL